MDSRFRACEKIREPRKLGRGAHLSHVGEAGPPAVRVRGNTLRNMGTLPLILSFSQWEKGRSCSSCALAIDFFHTLFRRSDSEESELRTVGVSLTACSRASRPCVPMRRLPLDLAEPR